MITIKNLLNQHQQNVTVEFSSAKSQLFDAKERWLILPAAIDGHVHFRTPGATEKEDWITGAIAALSGGVTTVIDMPNNNPACISLSSLIAKKQLIDEQLKQTAIPLRYGLYFGADAEFINEIPHVKNHVVGIKIFLGASTGELLISNDCDLERIFEMAHRLDMVVSVHAEDENILVERKKQFKGRSDSAIHSHIRDRQAAISAVEKVLFFAKKHQTKTFVLHISTKEEVELIRKAKVQKIPVFAETTPHHLFLNDTHYSTQGNFVKMNPPLRTAQDQTFLWQGIADGTIDTIGSDHAPHLAEEKSKSYQEAPSGVPGVETLLPLLINAYHKNLISIKKIVELTQSNIIKILSLPKHHDQVIIDLDKIQTVQNSRIKSKCGWSPFADHQLHGWPIYTILDGKVFEVQNGKFI